MTEKNTRTHRPADVRLQEAMAQVAKLQAKVNAEAVNASPEIQAIDAQIKQHKADRQAAKLAAGQWEDKVANFLARANAWREKGQNAEVLVAEANDAIQALQEQRSQLAAEIAAEM